MTEKTALRDRIAWRLASLAMRIATPWYRDRITGAIRYGLLAEARDTARQNSEDREADRG